MAKTPYTCPKIQWIQLKLKGKAGKVEDEGVNENIVMGEPLKRYLSKKLNDVKEGNILVPEG